MATVRIPTQLRPLSGGAAEVKLGRIPLDVSAAKVNWLTSSRPPPVSARERFIRSWSSAKTR